MYYDVLCFPSVNFPLPSYRESLLPVQKALLSQVMAHIFNTSTDSQHIPRRKSCLSNEKGSLLISFLFILPFLFPYFSLFHFCFFCKPILPDFYFLRQGLSVCSPGCPGTHRNPPAFPPRYWIKGMHQHTWLSVCCFVLVAFICVCA